jgi:hypothetical protein
LGAEWVPIVVAVISATPPTIAALWAIRRAGKANANVYALRVEVNHRLSELLKAARAEGEVQGRDAAHRERSDREGEGG